MYFWRVGVRSGRGIAVKRVDYLVGVVVVLRYCTFVSVESSVLSPPAANSVKRLVHCAC